MIVFTIVGAVLVIVGLVLLLAREGHNKLERARDDLGRKRIGL